MMMMRWQLAYPYQPLPVLGPLLGDVNAPGGIISPEFYNQLAAMHSTIMIFLGVVPLAVGGFGNYVIPLQIGASERIKQDANPGIMVPVWFTPTVTGEFDVACSQSCGLGHYRMKAVLRVVAPEEFQRWLASQPPSAP